jgi:signal transduction histidine kinase
MWVRWKAIDRMRNSPNRSRLPISFPLRGVNLQIITIIILPLTIILVAVTFGSLSLHQQAMRTLVGERDERAARTASGALSDHIKFRLLLVQNLSLLAASAVDQQLDITLKSSKDMLNEFDGGLAFFSPDDVLLAAIGDQDFWGQYADSRIDLSAQLSPHTSIQVLPFERGNMVVLTAWQPDEGTITAGAFSIESLASKSLESTISSNQDTSIFLVDADYQLLYQKGEFLPDLTGSDHVGISRALDGISGTTFQVNDGIEHVVAYNPVEMTGWALVIEEPWEAVTNPMLRTTGFAPLVLVPVLLLALLALGFAARQIVKPLQNLEDKAVQLSWGDYEAIEEPVGGVTEIRHLQRELIHLAQKVQFAQKSLHNYIGAITAGQEEERHRLARELHDDTLQSLIALKQRVQLAHLDNNDGHVVRLLPEIEKMAEDTIDNLRRLTRDLRPIYLEDLGLVAALEMLAREVEQVSGFKVSLQFNGYERRLSATIELALYRIVQESLSNVARHARASLADVTLTYSPQDVRLEISDHGIGFKVPKSPADFAPGDHFGLLGMYERAQLISAEFSVQSSPGEGTRILVILPEEQNPQ